MYTRSKYQRKETAINRIGNSVYYWTKRSTQIHIFRTSKVPSMFWSLNRRVYFAWEQSRKIGESSIIEDEALLELTWCTFKMNPCLSVSCSWFLCGAKCLGHQFSPDETALIQVTLQVDLEHLTACLIAEQSKFTPGLPSVPRVAADSEGNMQSIGHSQCSQKH